MKSCALTETGLQKAGWLKKWVEASHWRYDGLSGTCITLISEIVFKEHLAYAPEMLFSDSDGQKRMYDEMWTGDWWWDIQVSMLLLRSKL